MSKKLAPFKGFNDPKNVSEQYRVVSFRDYESASQLGISSPTCVISRHRSDHPRN